MEYKKTAIFLLIIVIAVAVILISFFIIGKKNLQNVPKEKSIEDIIKEDLTAPSQEEPQISEDIMKNLSAPKK